MKRCDCDLGKNLGAAHILSAHWTKSQGPHVDCTGTVDAAIPLGGGTVRTGCTPPRPLVRPSARCLSFSCPARPQLGSAVMRFPPPKGRAASRLPGSARGSLPFAQPRIVESIGRRGSIWPQLVCSKPSRHVFPPQRIRGAAGAIVSPRPGTVTAESLRWALSISPSHAHRLHLTATRPWCPSGALGSLIIFSLLRGSLPWPAQQFRL